MPYMRGRRLLGQVVPSAKAPARLVEPFVNVWGKGKDTHQARFYPFGQTGLEPFVSVVPFVRVVGRAKEIRLLLLEQHVEALVKIPDVVLTGRGNDDVGLGDIQRI